MSDQTLKKDAGKPPMSLMPRSALESLSRVLAFGAKKYAPHGWRRGMEWSRLNDAALRHLLAFIDGEDIDPESGESHLGHLLCCAAFLEEYRIKGMGTDDRYRSHAAAHEVAQ